MQVTVRGWIRAKDYLLNMAGLMLALMQLPSGPDGQTTEPHGLEWKQGSRTLGRHKSSVNRVAICSPLSDDSLERIQPYANEKSGVVWIKESLELASIGVRRVKKAE